MWLIGCMFVMAIPVRSVQNSDMQNKFVLYNSYLSIVHVCMAVIQLSNSYRIPYNKVIS